MTAQVPDRLHFQEQCYRIFSEPLYQWLSKRQNRNVGFKRGNTACRRGYVGEWEVTEDRLYLINIHGGSSKGLPVTVGDLFPDSPERVFANWYSGIVRCMIGRMLAYSHAGYSSIYEQELHLSFQEGVLVGQRTIKNEPPVPDEYDSMVD